MKIKSLLLALVGTLWVSCNAQNPNVSVVGPAEFRDAFGQDKEGVLLDVRRAEEYSEGHLKGARLMDWLDTEAFKRSAATLDKKRTIYVYCRSGRRSNAAANWLAGQGYKVVDMKGGFLAWEAAGLPIALAAD